MGSTRLRVLPFAVADPATNMAIDEALLAAAAPGSDVTLRFYGWLRPTVSLGYAQPWRSGYDVPVARRLGMPVVRRRTGGRAVLHAGELTYSVTGGAESGPFAGGIQDTYGLIARGFAAGFARLGIDVQMVRSRGRRSRDEPGACFAARALNEITADGRKLVGSAQRRARGRVLQHGSILLERPQARLWRVLGATGPQGAAESVGVYELAGRPALRRIMAHLADGLAQELGASRSTAALSRSETRTAAGLRAQYADPVFTRRR